ncbi:MAG: DHH family phosphoesterase [archaeon]
MEKLKKIQKIVKSSRRIAVICHQNADPDSLCSGFGLSYLLRRIQRKLAVDLVTPGGVNKASKSVMNELPIKISVPNSFESFEALFTVDMNTTQQLGDIREQVENTSAPIIVIDHHAPDPRTRKLAEVLICDQRASSAAEVVHWISRQFRTEWSKTAAQALLTGMVYDSNHFALARPAAFRAAVDLIDAGADPRRSVAMLRLPMGESERMARIKAGQRIQPKIIDGWVIASSHVSAHQASAARALIMLGAHVAVVAGEKEGEIRISLRSTEEFYRGTGVHLGTDIARAVGKVMGGMGGGHALASGATGRGEVDKALQLCVTLVEKKLSGEAEKSAESSTS